MEVYTLVYNSEIVGIFSDKDEFKRQSFHFILDTLINNNLFVNKKECGTAIKQDLKNLYSETVYSFSYSGHKFSKLLHYMNKMNCVSIPVQYSADVTFMVYTPNELSIPLTMLSIEDLITKK